VGEKKEKERKKKGYGGTVEEKLLENFL